jgi:hypothetical protein
VKQQSVHANDHFGIVFLFLYVFVHFGNISMRNICCHPFFVVPLLVPHGAYSPHLHQYINFLSFLLFKHYSSYKHFHKHLAVIFHKKKNGRNGWEEEGEKANRRVNCNFRRSSSFSGGQPRLFMEAAARRAERWRQQRAGRVGAGLHERGKAMGWGRKGPLTAGAPPEAADDGRMAGEAKQ